MNACPKLRARCGTWTAGALLGFAALGLGTVFARAAGAQQSDLVAHEWGTFTSIAGNSGAAVEWYPWAAPSDLPDFIEHLEARELKLSLNGTIRMETPVIYFYSSRETTLSVHVSFAKGLITEWYPHATRSTPDRGKVRNASLSRNQPDGSVSWERVALRPDREGALPRERAPSRYYAARETGATPLEVSAPGGEQYEKFLFYRGVSSEASPVTAKVLTSGRIEVTNFKEEPASHLFLFERRGTALGIRSLTNAASSAVVEAPELDRTVETVTEEIRAALLGHGLYPDEAQAMLETWKDSWFEEGSRLLYLVPETFVGRVLPLAISPEPGQTTRVFVGRLELVTPATRTAILTALARGDEPTLKKYNRFLEPMLRILLERESDPRQAEVIRQRQKQPYSALVAQEASARRPKYGSAP
jgi:hypothetical protein